METILFHPFSMYVYSLSHNHASSQVLCFNLIVWIRKVQSILLRANNSQLCLLLFLFTLCRHICFLPADILCIVKGFGLSVKRSCCFFPHTPSDTFRATSDSQPFSVKLKDSYCLAVCMLRSFQDVGGDVLYFCLVSLLTCLSLCVVGR